MLPNTQDMIQMCSFDATKSTRGASKLRRDLINAEIANLRDLLPLPSSTRQRLSQLQLMALVCVYVRKANYFQQVFRKCDLNDMMTPNFGFSKAMSGFLMMMTQNGKLLYISDNAAEYLGHSMEDLLIHGDSVYDIIDKQDHQAVQTELMRGPLPTDVSVISGYTPNGGVGDGNDDDEDERFFLCRMNVSRNARRQMRFGDQKVVLMQGHFLSFLPLCSRNEPVFLATCTPVAMPETRECVVQGSTNIFTSIHTMDMKFVHIDKNGEFHLGYNREQIQGTSWYQLIHSDSIREAQSKHRMITQTDQDRACILLLRLQTQSGYWIWLHVVLQVKDNMEGSQHPVIVCTNQVLSERAASVMRANSWLYHYYTVQSKLQYSLALQESEAATSATRTQQSTPPTYYHHHHHHHDVPPGPPLPPPPMAYPAGLQPPLPPGHHNPHLHHHHHHHHPHHQHPPPHHHHHHHQHPANLTPEAAIAMHHPHQLTNHHHQLHGHSHLGLLDLQTTSRQAPSNGSSGSMSTSSYGAFGATTSSSSTSTYHQYDNSGTTNDSAAAGESDSPTRRQQSSPPRMTSLQHSTTVDDNWTDDVHEQQAWLHQKRSTGSARLPSSLARTSAMSARSSAADQENGHDVTSAPSSSSLASVEDPRHCSRPSAVHNNSTRAKYERKLRQMDNIHGHQEPMVSHYHHPTSGGDDDIASLALHCVPSPTDPQTVPDRHHVIIRPSATMTSSSSLMQQFASEHYVPEMISSSSSPSAVELYAWNHHHQVILNNRHSQRTTSPEVSIRPNVRYPGSKQLLHHLHQTSTTSTSDGETVSLHTSPSPTYNSSAGSPDFAVPHTPETWPFVTATSMVSHYMDDTIVAAARKRLKVSRDFKDVQSVQAALPPAALSKRTTDATNSGGATSGGATSAAAMTSAGDRLTTENAHPKCRCHADTCAPRCPCVRTTTSSSSSSASTNRRQCCTVAQLSSSSSNSNCKGHVETRHQQERQQQQ